MCPIIVVLIREVLLYVCMLFVCVHMCHIHMCSYVSVVYPLVLPMVAPLINTSGAMTDRHEGNLIVEPLGTLNRVINTVVTSDPCPSVR